MRLEKFLAEAGVASRRGAKALILDRRATVNGRVVTVPGTDVNVETDDVRVDGKSIRRSRELHYYVLNKPSGYLCTAHDPQGRRTVFDLLPQTKDRLFMVGRLDRDVEGLLLVTSDGELAFRLSHPRYEVGKTYIADVRGAATPDRIQLLHNGVVVEGRRTAPAEAHAIRCGRDSSTVRLVVHEGRKHQVKLMCMAVGLPVKSLRRVALGPLRLAGLPTGGYRPLSAVEIRALRRSVGI